MSFNNHLNTASEHGWWHLTYQHLDWVVKAPKRSETMILHAIQFGQVDIFQKIWTMIAQKHASLTKKLQVTLLDQAMQTSHGNVLLHLLTMSEPVMTTAKPKLLMAYLKKAYKASTSALHEWVKERALSTKITNEAQKSEPPGKVSRIEVSSERLEHTFASIVARHKLTLEASGGGEKQQAATQAAK